MSVYLSKSSPYYRFDFEYRGIRHYGSTKRTDRSEAEQIESEERELARLHPQPGETQQVSLYFGDAVGSYLDEVGWPTSRKKHLRRALYLLSLYFAKYVDPDVLLTDITDSHIAKLVAWRRSHRVVRGRTKEDEEYPPVSDRTVSRSTVEPLKGLFNHAKDTWGVKFDHEPVWETHQVSEPEGDVYEAVADER